MMKNLMSFIKLVICFRPGFCRLNLPYTMNEDELDFVLHAVKEITDNGWKLLPLVSSHLVMQ